MPSGPQAAALSTAKSPFSTSEPMTAREDIVAYNNFYEFGTDKGDPAAHAARSRRRHGRSRSTASSTSRPTTTLDDSSSPSPLEERIYRMRCVEGWSMVIPWDGFPLAELLKRAGPHGQRQVRRLRDARPARRDAGTEWPFPGARLALCRGPAPRRGDASADDPRHGLYGETSAEPERRADPAGRAVEIRLQGHQVDRPHQPRRQAAANVLEQANAAGIRLLLQRQSGGRSSALEPGDGAAHRRGDGLLPSGGRH